MSIKRFKPATPGARFRHVVQNDEVTAKTGEKSLLRGAKAGSGRNNLGRITVRRRGGGVKRKYRVIDFSRTKVGVPATVLSIEYDPFRSALVALIRYADGEKTYIIAPKGLKEGQTLVSSENDTEIQLGNMLPLSAIPTGSVIHNVQMKLNSRFRIARSAGTGATLMAKTDEYATIRLPSGEVRLVNLDCTATIGEVSNADHRNRVIGKAGANRWRGRRPKVRGSVMNPVDHPHGGGEGRAPIGRPSPVTPWGKPTMGYKTRKKNNPSDKYIVKRRSK
jgi:large subunit ribosomal protein L2